MKLDAVLENLQKIKEEYGGDIDCLTFAAGYKNDLYSPKFLVEGTTDSRKFQMVIVNDDKFPLAQNPE
jgi:hypothetical protein